MVGSKPGLSKSPTRLLSKRTWRNRGQLELPIHRPLEKDRNFHLGGRSFYFFDFDDNIAFLTTPSYIFHKKTGEEKIISSGEFAQVQASIGKAGAYRDFEIRFDDRTGTFRCFRDKDIRWLQRILGREQNFVQDLAQALGAPDFQWKGPSWDCFYHAAFNGRPLSIITARGHAPETIQRGIDLFVTEGFLPAKPNYLSVFPVSHRPTRRKLGDHDFRLHVADLKKAAIRASVEKALKIYGYNSHHRFGMSDDDPRNIQLILEAMKQLKTDYPENSFFVIETQKGQYIKHEVCHNRIEDQKLESQDFQLNLF